MSNNKILSKRIIAVTIDMFLTLVFLVIILLMLFIIGRNNKTILNFLTLQQRIYDVIKYYVSIWLYFTLQEAIFGKTIGKKIMGLNVITYDYKKPTILQSSIRNIFRITDQLFYIGSIPILFDSKERRFGDIIAKTIVVENNTLDGIKMK